VAQTVRYVRAVKLALAAAGIIILGCLLLFAPSLHANPSGVSATELMYGGLVLGAGLLLMVWAGWSALKKET
jgi:hypothetical protein